MAKGVFRRRWFPPARKLRAPAVAPATPAFPLRRRPPALAAVFRRRRKWFPRHAQHFAPAAPAASPALPFAKRPRAVVTAFRRRRKWSPPKAKRWSLPAAPTATPAPPYRKRPAALGAVFRRHKKWSPRRKPAPALPFVPPPVAALPCRKKAPALTAAFPRRRKWRPYRRLPSLFGLPSLGFGFARHYTGVLTPLGTKRVDQYAQIAPPAAPALSAVAGGALSAATYVATITYVSPSGETIASAEASLAVGAGNLLRIAAPVAAGNASGWNAYVGTASGAEQKQNALPLALASAWTEPPSGLVGGAAPPSTNSTGWEVFNLFVPDPVATARYTSNPIDTGFDDDLRVQAEIVAHAGPGQSGAAALGFAIDTWLGGETEPYGFTPWTIGFVTMRHLRGRVDYAPIVAGAVAYLQDLVITIDTSPRVETGGSFDVAAGGSVLVFPAAFHFPPFMPAPNVLLPTGAGYYATATSLSATEATITIFDHTGASVAGRVSWSATGE